MPGSQLSRCRSFFLFTCHDQVAHPSLGRPSLHEAEDRHAIDQAAHPSLLYPVDHPSLLGVEGHRAIYPEPRRPALDQAPTQDLSSRYLSTSQGWRT